MHGLLQGQQTTEADPYWDHLVSQTKLLFNFLLTSYFLCWRKTLAQLVIISQALRTLTLIASRSEVKSCSETSVCFIESGTKVEKYPPVCDKKDSKPGLTHCSSVNSFKNIDLNSP